MIQMKKIIIHEVGLRDGIQNESQIVPEEIKLDWAERLASSGVDIIQLGSFVNPARVPQMASTEMLFSYFRDFPVQDVVFSGLALNEKGLDRAMSCGVGMVCMGVSASETHSLKNTGKSTGDATEIILAMADKANTAGLKTQLSVQSAFGCGFEGKIDENKVYKIIERYFEKGFYNISLADTAGHAFPSQVKKMVENVLEIYSDASITCHFHNTFGLGIANCLAAYESGVTVFETSFGGFGGCPFTKVAAGNVATEDFAHWLRREGMCHNADINKLIELAREASQFFGRLPESYVTKAGIIPY